MHYPPVSRRVVRQSSQQTSTFFLQTSAHCHFHTSTTSKTPEGRSATFRVQGLVLFFLFFFSLFFLLPFLHSGAQNLIRLGASPWRPFFHHLISFVFVLIFVFFDSIFYFTYLFFVLYTRAGQKKTRETVGRDTKVFEFVKLVLRP